MWTLLFDDALPAALFERVRRGVAEHPTIGALYEHSFWFPVGATPRLDIEHAIVALGQLLPPTDGLAGAEWWVPALASSQGMEWHCDCDRIVYARDKQFVRPRISSILYLTATGGPTLVADDVAVDHRARRPRTDHGCTGLLPMPNRYGIFPGDRFHAVASSDDEQLRITVAINWWAAKPSAPLCIDTPYEAPALARLIGPAGAPAAAATPRPAPQIELTAHQMAALPHRKFCPIYSRPPGGGG